ncbi:hypothetical protein [Bartonella sp. TP]|uniref:response regulator transcription factor n=1 Tax=Bartonella sp. TP TaxID=3057550 RepID=UPI0025B254C6|nr:hypothetical protein [Bartonella sp. TP]MDN5248538.1 hypothetical protein [Alphaproteobacteria bacterium]WJW79540.1 hypothetical protein QVL57_03180 [Bartonella sp. TP]
MSTIALYINDTILHRLIAEQLNYIADYKAQDYAENTQDYDLLIIDLDSVELNNFIPNAAAPILALANAADIQSQIAKLDFEINDYLSKPFRLTHLLKRISERLSKNQLCFSCANYKFYASKNLFINDKEHMIKITPKEVEIISYLYQEKARFVGTKELLSNIKGIQEISLYRLRQKFGNSNILCKNKAGYRLNL